MAKEKEARDARCQESALEVAMRDLVCGRQNSRRNLRPGFQKRDKIGLKMTPSRHLHAPFALPARYLHAPVLAPLIPPAGAQGRAACSGVWRTADLVSMTRQPAAKLSWSPCDRSREPTAFARCVAG